MRRAALTLALALVAAWPAIAAAPPPLPEPSELVTALDGIDPDALSPREALEALYKLKRLAKA